MSQADCLKKQSLGERTSTREGGEMCRGRGGEAECGPQAQAPRHPQAGRGEPAGMGKRRAGCLAGIPSSSGKLTLPETAKPFH